MEEFLTGVVTVVGAVVLIAGLSLLFTLPLVWAINYIFAPSLLTFVFGAAQITFWKAYVLGFVTATLFKGTYTSSSSK